MAAEQSKQAAAVEPPKKQKRLFKRKRAGVVLTAQQVKEIKQGRKKLRRELRKQGIKKKKDFELTASSLGLYFDKSKKLALFWWLFWGKGKWLWLTAAAVLIGVLYGMSYVTDLHGHFTVSMSDRLFRDGFSISEIHTFETPTSHLFASPADGVPCISITRIPDNIDADELGASEEYFAYTFYVKNEGDVAQSLDWSLDIRSQSQNLSEAAWVMIFVDGKATIYAKADENGEVEALPAFDDNTRGYTQPPLCVHMAEPETQFEMVDTGGVAERWRVKPKPFLAEAQIASGRLEDVYPTQYHKFTVVVWLEGDDPDCTDELIGGHIGLDFAMEAVDESEEEAEENQD